MPPAAEEARRSYMECSCIFCGYHPYPVTGRLEILIIKGHPCFCCLACEIQTIPQGDPT